MKTNRLDADALLSIVFLTLVWGSSYMLIKKSLLVFSPFEVAALRVSISAMVSFPFFYRSFQSIPKEKMGWVVLTGLLGSAIPALCFAVATTRVGSSVNGVLNSLSPLFTLLTASLLFKQSFHPIRFLGVLLGLAGAALLVFLPQKHGQFSGSFYAILPVLATLCYGLSSNIVRHKLMGVSSFKITAAAIGLIGMPLTGILLLQDTFSKAMSGGEASLAFAYLCILSIAGTFLAWMVFYRLVQRTDALFGMSVTYLIPVVAIAWGVWDGEAFGVNGMLALGFILTGVYLSMKDPVTDVK